MEELIVLVNFNSYLGGGETLMVRFCEYLQKKEVNYLAFCLKDSYIETDLYKRKIDKLLIKAFTTNPNFYYLSGEERKHFLNALTDNLRTNIKVRMVTFCMRDLYTAYAISLKFQQFSISHLVLHIQDDLYVGQTIFDKIYYKLTKKLHFNLIKNIQVNRRLVNIVNKNGGLISMADLISKFWRNRFGIEIPSDHVIPLPSFRAVSKDVKTKLNTKKIIWIGRIVDFKIPSILAMLDFIKLNQDYTLTIIGTGNKQKLLNYIQKNEIDLNRINFLGEIPYDKLEDLISQHSIGYAMGTSLVELAKYKMPVIVALANYEHSAFEKPICGGLFYDKDKGCDGSALMLTSQDQIKDTIVSCIKEIEKDYLNIATMCYEFAKNGYNEELNFAKYLDIIKHTSLLSIQDKNLKLPYPSIFRKLLFKKIQND